MCDDHLDRPAVARVQGETDSFGSELYDLCAECLAEIRKEMSDARIGVCDWCRTDANDLRHARDYEEGLTGRVYEVCGECIRRANEVAQREIDEYDREHYR
jgi:hypothetical protein